MKKITSAAVAFVMLSGAAFAGDEASLDMAAVVSERCDVSLVGTNPNVLFGLDQTVANVDAVCNLPGKIKLTIASTNLGKLENSTAGGGEIPYTVDVHPRNVADTDVSGKGDNMSIASPIILTFNAGKLLGGAQVDIRVNVGEVENNGKSVFAGSYEDTLTFVIASADVS